MKKEVIASAKTIDEAIEEACKELMINREDANVEILDIPKKGFLGIGQSLARVKVTVPTIQPDIFSKIEIAKRYLTSILEEIGLDNFNIEIHEKTLKKSTFVLSGENLGLAIGKRGDTLDALQYLCSIAANMDGGSYCSINLDVGNYRETREKALKELATKISHSVMRSGKKIILEPMNSYERKIIHETIQNINGVRSQSRGEDPHRYIIVSLDFNKRYSNNKRLDTNHLNQKHRGVS